MSALDFLHSIREHELQYAISQLPKFDPREKKITLLELGSGTGHQAKILSELGFAVTALDLPTSAYRTQRVFPVLEYDGKNIPCESESIQIVFSSNVLEHVEEIDSFLDEIHRVLAPGGCAIHILPTSTCRFWSIIAHYGWLAKNTTKYFLGKIIKNANLSERDKGIAPPKNREEIIKTLFPSRHGERGNSVTEIYYYSQYWWDRKFIEHNYRIEDKRANGIFYTMANVFEFKLSIEARKKMAVLLGSACRIYFLKKNESPSI